MNFAFPAGVLLLISLPGILFRFFYRRGVHASPLNIRNFAEEVAYSLLFTSTIHALAVPLVTFLGFKPSLYQVLVLLTGMAPLPDPETKALITSLATSAFNIYLYFALTSLTGAIAGAILHALVEWNFWDVRMPIFRFPDRWEYLFSGRMYTYERLIKRNKRIDLRIERRYGSVGIFAKILIWHKQRARFAQLLRQQHRFLGTRFVSCVIEQADVSYLYTGHLHSYEFSPSGDLDRIVLTNSGRMPLPVEWNNDLRLIHTFPRDGLHEATKHFPIIGGFLTIQYADIRTLHVDFLLILEHLSQTAVMSDVKNT